MRTSEQTVRAVIEEIWNLGQVDRVGCYIAENYIVEGTPVGQTWVANNVMAFRRAFAGLNISVEQLIANDVGQVSALMRIQGRHVEQWNGIPGSNRQVDYREAGFWQVENGMILSGDFVADTLSLRIQLGQIPESVWRGSSMVESAG